MIESFVPAPDYDKNKTAYFSYFATGHLSAFRPHYRQGETLGKGPEVWRNVSEHCLVAGVFADILAEQLHLSEPQRDMTVKAAILHDWFKKHEALAQQAANKEGGLTLAIFNQIKEKDTQALRAMGVHEDIIELAGANIPRSDAGPDDLLSKILWYVDAMLSITEPVPIGERFDDLERGWDGKKEDGARAQRNVTFSNIFREQYDGKSLYDVQRELGAKIGTEFAQLMRHPGEASQLPIFLKQKLQERVVTFRR